MIRSLSVKRLGFQPTDRRFVMWFSWVVTAFSFFLSFCLHMNGCIYSIKSHAMNLEQINWRVCRLSWNHELFRISNNQTALLFRKIIKFGTFHRKLLLFANSNVIDLHKVTIFMTQLGINGSESLTTRVHSIIHIYLIFYAPIFYICTICCTDGKNNSNIWKHHNDNGFFPQPQRQRQQQPSH